MIGEQPTVGCVACMGDISVDDGLRRTIMSIGALVHTGVWNNRDGGLTASLPLGTESLDAILLVYAYEDDRAVYACLYFDEEGVVQMSRRTGLTICELLAPYVSAMQMIDVCAAVGLGFELSPPAGQDDGSLKEAGISQVFVKDEAIGAWSRRQLYPMVGHYL